MLGSWSPGQEAVKEVTDPILAQGSCLDGNGSMNTLQKGQWGVEAQDAYYIKASLCPIHVSSCLAASSHSENTIPTPLFPKASRALHQNLKFDLSLS